MIVEFFGGLVCGLGLYYVVKPRRKRIEVPETFDFGSEKFEQRSIEETFDVLNKLSGVEGIVIADRDGLPIKAVGVDDPEWISAYGVKIFREVEEYYEGCDSVSIAIGGKRLRMIVLKVTENIFGIVLASGELISQELEMIKDAILNFVGERLEVQ